MHASFPSISRCIYIYIFYTYTLSFLFSVSVHVLSQCDISRTSPRATWFNSHAFLLRRSLCSFCSFTLSFPFRLCSSSLHQVLHPFCPFPRIWPRFLRSTDSLSLLLSLSPDTMRRRPSSVNEFWRSPGPLTIASRRAASHVCIRPRGSVPFRYVANINETGVQIRTHPSFLFYRPKLFARYTRQRRKIPWRTFSC